MDIVIRKQSEQIQRSHHDKSNLIFYDKKWEWGFLRKQCRNLELEQFYLSYMHKLQRSYLSIFIVIQALFGISHVIMLLAAVDNYEYIYVDIISYISSIILVWIALFICFREDIMKTRPNVVYAASFIVVFVLVLTDLLVPIYDAAHFKQTLYLRPSCGSYILYAVYIFIPLNENWHALILGLAVTICYLINFAMVTYKNDEYIILRTFTEAIFLLCINMLGFYFRMMKEIYIRTTFIDRRECVEENLLLKYARDQEKSLLLSIIPAQTADKIEREVRERIEKIKVENLNRMSTTHHGSISDPPPVIRRWRKPDSMKLFIEPHNDVSVLYADVVNYTYLTTQLDVQTLVETIHDLFVKFDQASEAHNVLRIKFLGDCYYCVSGVPIKNAHHAKSCVDLGLRMIKDIREVRKRRNLDIDMRIGVHSGNIFSGVIGACKWQYDIWSKDVDIANRLESTGEAGKVHISQQTLDLLNDEYDYSDGTQKAQKDEVLKKYGIKSYLITPPRSYFSDHGYRNSIGARRMIENLRHSKMDSSMNFMQNTIEQYNQIRIQAKLEMSRELDKMPIGKFSISNICMGERARLTEDEMEERNFRNNVSTFLLMFKDYRWEMLFLREPDVLLKYSIIIAFIVFVGILMVQGINRPSNTIFWIVNTIDGLILLSFVFIAWYKKVWIMINPAPGINLDDDPEESSTDRKPKNVVSRFFYDLSDNVMRSILARGVIYLMTVITLCLTSLLQLTTCDEDESTGPQLCINPWAITESLIMTICMSFLFSRIPFLFKLLVGFIIVCVYGYIVMYKYEFVFNQSVSTNRNLKAEYSHMMVVILTFAIFHLIDRQSEYISKVDYTWKRQLQKKQEDAEFTNETIKILIHNILPAHVAHIYMMKKIKDEHYFEEYDNVAVMFATIKNYDSEKTGLDVLNGIICDFDEKLMNYKGPLTIEKIKIAGWSYMAACGLDETRCSSATSFTGNRPSSRSSGLLPTGRRLNSNAIGSRVKRMSYDGNGVLPIRNGLDKQVKKDKKQGLKEAESVVYVMTEFALELMKSLEAFNRENFQQEDDSLNHQFQLRIGISHGKVMAGVVGSSKPLYDIWGNAVNMASRMDSTGIPGYIQVTEETAKILQSFSIKCDYRGLTFVKGCDNIPTYFVAINDDLSFIRKSITGPNLTYENVKAAGMVRNASTMF